MSRCCRIRSEFRPPFPFPCLLPTIYYLTYIVHGLYDPGGLPFGFVIASLRKGELAEGGVGVLLFCSGTLRWDTKKKKGGGVSPPYPYRREGGLRCLSSYIQQGGREGITVCRYVCMYHGSYRTR